MEWDGDGDGGWGGVGWVGGWVNSCWLVDWLAGGLPLSGRLSGCSSVCLSVVIVVVWWGGVGVIAKCDFSCTGLSHVAPHPCPTPAFFLLKNLSGGGWMEWNGMDGWMGWDWDGMGWDGVGGWM